MKLIYTEQALFGLEEALEFIAPKVTQEKLLEIRDRIWECKFNSVRLHFQ